MVVVVKDSPYNAIRMEKQELVGNCKEFRIDSNKIHLRIIGNGNRILINQNYGFLEVIGNTTRVKIANNSGKINFTGNNGKVYLGRDSSIKNVEYVGNNGILKLVNTIDLLNESKTDRNKSKSKSGNQTPDTTSSSSSTSSTSTSTSTSTTSNKSPMKSYIHTSNVNDHNDDTTNSCNYKKSHRSSSSRRLGSCSSCTDGFSLSIKNNISLPNLDAIDISAHIHLSNSIRIACSTGNIVVNNSYRI